MFSRPKPLIWLMFVLFGVAASFPLQIMWLYGHPWEEMPAVFQKLTFLNWMVMTGSVIAGVWIFNAAPGAQTVMHILAGLVAVNNFFVGYFATDFSPWAASFATLCFGALCWPLRSPEISFLLKHPEKRWWRAHKRRKVHIPIFLGGSRRTQFRSETWDISESGSASASRSIRFSKCDVTAWWSVSPTRTARILPGSVFNSLIWIGLSAANCAGF